MPTDRARDASLTAELIPFVRAGVASHHDENAGELVSAGLRLLQQGHPSERERNPRAKSHRHAPQT